MAAFKVAVDTVQQRLKVDGVSTLVGKQDWDLALSTGVFLDGITGTMMLTPAALNGASWQTSNSGIYAKLPPTDFTFVPAYAAGPPPNWIYDDVNGDGAPFYRYPNNTVGAGGYTNYNLAVNQAMVVEVFVPQGTAANGPLFNIGWSPSNDFTTGVALKFYNDLSADIYKNGVFLDHQASSGKAAEYGQTAEQVPQQVPGQYIRVLFIPFRERELLVLTSSGAGFSYVFADIPEGTASPIITPAAPFFFYAEPGVDQSFRCALCQYVSSGNAIGKLSFWRYEPGATPAGGFQTWIDSDLPAGCTAAGAVGGVGVVDGVNPSIAYASNTNGVRMNIALAGTGALTPFLYGTRGYTLPQLANTVGPALDVTANVLSLSYDSTDSIGGTKASITLSDPKGIIAAGVVLDGVNKPGALIDMISERPWQITDDDGTQVLEGIGEPPKLTECIRFQTAAETAPGSPTYGDQTNTNVNEAVAIDIRDGSLMAENLLFKEPIPLDGKTFADAYTLVTDNGGVTDSAGGRSPNISAAIGSVVLQKAGNPTNNDFNVLIEAGDSCQFWMDRLLKTYASNAFHGLKPMGGWNQPQVLTTADLPSTPAVTLYDSIETALAHGVMAPTYLDLFRTLDVQMLKPEANDLYVYGYDYRYKRPILIHKLDGPSADPTVIPASRTPAWRGSRVSYTWIDPTLSTIGVATYVMGLLFPRLTVARSLVEFECDFKSLLPRGSLVKLYFAPGGGVKHPATGAVTNPVTCRIKTLSARFEQVGNTNASKWRPARYVAQVGTDGSNLHTGNVSAAGIAAEWATRAVSKTVQWGDANDKEIWRRPLILQAEA